MCESVRVDSESECGDMLKVSVKDSCEILKIGETLLLLILTVTVLLSWIRMSQRQ